MEKKIRLHEISTLTQLRDMIDEAIGHGVPDNADIKVCASNKREGDSRDFIGYLWSLVYDSEHVYLTITNNKFIY